MLGLIGLGLVGSALFARFKQAGFAVCGFDTNTEAISRLVAHGLQPCTSPSAVAARARRIVLCLPNSSIVDSVVEGEHGLVENAQPGDLIVDTTTADPVASAALAQRLQARDIRFVDATILGSSQQVQNGDILVMAGGSPKDFASCADLFAACARRAFHMGANCKGAEAKLVVNLVLGLNRLVLAEGLLLGEWAGMDGNALLEVLREGAAYSRVMDHKGEKMLRSDFSPQARLAQHLKDVGLILQLGERTGAPLPLSALHERVLQQGVEAGLGELDNSAVIAALRLLGERGEGREDEEGERRGEG